jgi:hypothetical protein
MELCQPGNANMPKTVFLMFAPPSAADAILAEVVRRLQELYHPVTKFTYSAPPARGEFGPDGDYGDFEERLQVKASLPSTLAREVKLLPGGWPVSSSRTHRQ